jgi:hypothetical protein
MVRKSVLILAFLVAGCAGDAQTRATNALAISCDAYATALEQLTPRKPTLTIALVARIDAANAMVRPVCAKDAKVDPAAVVGTVQAALSLLSVIKGGN